MAHEIGTTMWLVIATSLIWIVYDIYAYATRKEKTISRVITSASWYSPMPPFILGLLIGHWLW